VSQDAGIRTINAHHCRTKHSSPLNFPALYRHICKPGRRQMPSRVIQSGRRHTWEFEPETAADPILRQNTQGEQEKYSQLTKLCSGLPEYGGSIAKKAAIAVWVRVTAGPFAGAAVGNFVRARKRALSRITASGSCQSPNLSMIPSAGNSPSAISPTVSENSPGYLCISFQAAAG
jgi:hypothetical protein